MTDVANEPAGDPSLPSLPPRDRFTIRWSESMGCYRVSVPNLDEAEVVRAEAYDRLEAEARRLREALEWAVGWLPSREVFATHSVNEADRYDQARALSDGTAPVSVPEQEEGRACCIATKGSHPPDCPCDCHRAASSSSSEEGERHEWAGPWWQVRMAPGMAWAWTDDDALSLAIEAAGGEVRAFLPASAVPAAVAVFNDVHEHAEVLAKFDAVIAEEVAPDA